MKIPPFVFFGTSEFSVILLEELSTKFGIAPDLVVTAPDRPVGRKQIITPPPAKVWAEENDVSVIQPEKLKDEDFLAVLQDYSLFIVASYGKIIPQVVLDIPKLGTLNVHPSLLPKYRGASPIQNQILNDEKHFGTTIMLMDDKMDHGPILAQKEIKCVFPDTYENVEKYLAIESASLLAETLSSWTSTDKKGERQAQHPAVQKEEEATYTKIIEKADGEINLDDDGYKNYLKYLAYSHWPKTFFFFDYDNKKMRAVITDASFTDGKFVINKLIPEGKNEMTYSDFLQSPLSKDFTR